MKGDWQGFDLSYYVQIESCCSYNKVGIYEIIYRKLSGPTGAACVLNEATLISILFKCDSTGSVKVQ
jgi:hypothetical protein